jgi:hypothetical protein
LSDDARAARVALTGFISEAQRLVDTAADATIYPITAFGVMARPSPAVDPPATPDPGDLQRQVLPWPLDVALADAGECLLVDGSAAVTLRQTLSHANALTLFEQDGVTYDTSFRPLLPHESGCAELLEPLP